VVNDTPCRYIGLKRTEKYGWDYTLNATLAGILAFSAQSTAPFLHSYQKTQSIQTLLKKLLMAFFFDELVFFFDIILFTKDGYLM
jgi:hypothetical protein